MRSFEFNWGWLLILIWSVFAIIGLIGTILRAIGWHFVAQ